MKGFKHFFVVPPVRGRRLTVRGLGIHEPMRPSIVNRPTGTGDYLFMLFYDEVTVGAGGKPELCKPGTLMIWTPGRTQYYGNAHQPYDHTWIHCDGSFVKEQIKRLALPCNRPLEPADIAATEKLFLLLYEELLQASTPDRKIVENILENWFRETARQLRAVVTHRYAPPHELLRIKHRLESEYEKPVKLSELAAMAHMSVPSFCAKFKEFFGTSAIDYHIKIRMNQAVYWLKDLNLAVQDVASRVGYDDIFYFSKLFKKHYGMSPRTMRNGWERPRGRTGGNT